MECIQKKHTCYLEVEWWSMAP